MPDKRRATRGSRLLDQKRQRGMPRRGGNSLLLRWLVDTWRLAGLVWTGLVVWASLVPSPPTPPDALSYDKLQHLSAYAFLALWWWPVLPGRRGRWTGMAALAMLGALLEVLQGLGPARHPEVADALANTLGIAVGALFALGLGWLAKKTPGGSRASEGAGDR